MTLAEKGAKLATDAGLEATAHTAALRTSVWEAVCESADVLNTDAISPASARSTASAKSSPTPSPTR